MSFSGARMWISVSGGSFRPCFMPEWTYCGLMPLAFGSVSIRSLSAASLLTPYIEASSSTSGLSACPPAEQRAHRLRREGVQAC